MSECPFDDAMPVVNNCVVPYVYTMCGTIKMRGCNEYSLCSDIHLESGPDSNFSIRM